MVIDAGWIVNRNGGAYRGNAPIRVGKGEWTA
jgi:hypothetical protein